MNQLWAWKFEGKTEWGLDFRSCFWTLCYPVGENKSRNKSLVTDLRKVKVVDEDAVQERTSADGLWVHDGKEWRTRYAMWRGKPLKTKEDWDNYYLAINPPITEPKNFGAIADASTRHYGFQSWFLAKNGTWTGENEDHVDWSDLINPIIISEGVEG